MTGVRTPLERLEAAVQEFVNSQNDSPALVGGALLVWEQVRFDEDGTPLRRIQYSLPSDGTTLAGSLGLAEAAAILLRSAVIGQSFDDHEDDE